ncbi:hypothetical protein Btru_061274 [Bulinus truncatus]|nr:hypothetical protein Btru_061274 [Bulinus truncatus]
MRLVEKHCSKYLAMFGECIKLHPHTWQIDCDLERRKLAKCAETNPEIGHIKQVCGKQFHVYETCMSEFQSDPEKCAEFFNVFSSCAQEALKTYGLASAPNFDANLNVKKLKNINADEILDNTSER